MDSSWDPATESMGMSSGAGDDGGAAMDGSWDCATKSGARGRDIIMPNLKSSVTTTASAVEYTDEVLKALLPVCRSVSSVVVVVFSVHPSALKYKVDSLEEAAKAKEAGVDGIIDQGCEAGGHVIGQFLR
ncbi:hypothetical protein ZEAMMB73_Zm00001d048910 [Zea mays]|uniref:Uncharacterized protein n=1 Tax=Zea mays TaxID=4577 RepID=A0A1D6PR48_MAIZE|nr:hypothetical protein ZEAMMB73_Zm00001d048910 [Zea mays]